jgi:hypothetical protein
MANPIDLLIAFYPYYLVPYCIVLGVSLFSRHLREEALDHKMPLFLSIIIPYATLGASLIYSGKLQSTSGLNEAFIETLMTVGLVITFYLILLLKEQPTGRIWYAPMVLIPILVAILSPMLN